MDTATPNVSVTKKSYASVSLLRLVAIALVFTFHIFYFGTEVDQYPWVYLFSGAVQTFFFLSGLLYSKRRHFDSGFYYREGQKLFGPCLVYFIVLILVDLGEMPREGEALNFLNVKMTMGNISPNGVYNIQFGNLWFLPALFVCYLLTPLLAKIATKSQKLLLILTLIENAVEATLMVFFGFPGIGIPYLWGYLLGGKDFEGEFEPAKKKNVFFFLWPWLALALLVAWNFSSPLLSGAWHWVVYYTNGPLKSVFGILFGIAFLRSTRFLNKSNEPRLLKSAGNLVFWIFLVHESIMTGFFNPLLQTSSFALGIVYSLLASIVLSLLLKFLDDYLKYFIASAHNGGQPLALR